jgi:hypothetical protein
MSCIADVCAIKFLLRGRASALSLNNERNDYRGCLRNRYAPDRTEQISLKHRGTTASSDSRF